MKIKVEQFEGPLDLLLQLIESQQLDITAVSLAAVTEQFLAYVRSLPAEASGKGGEKNPTYLADFLLISAKLLVIKSKALLPNMRLDVEEEEAAYDLTSQLLLYKKYKEVGHYLKRLDMRRRQAWSREPEFESMITFLPDPAVTKESLAASLGRLALELRGIVKLPEKIMEEVVSISEKIEQIQKLISIKLQVSLADSLKDSHGRTEVIVTFLALLELIKQGILSVEQNEMFGDIAIKKT